MIKQATVTLGVVIVTYDGADVATDCLETLIGAADADGICLSVVVVDNASNDATAQVVSDWRDGTCAYTPPDDLPISHSPVGKPITGHRIDIVEMPFNCGFAGGVNAGIAHLARDATLTRFWVLNPDSVVPQGTPRAFAAADPGPFSLMGGRVLYFEPADMVQIDGGIVNRWTGVTHNANLFAKASQTRPPSAEDVDFIAGASMVVSRAHWETVGPMREDFFLYYEETDWSLRRGDLPLAICPEAVIYHRAGTAIGSPGINRPATPFSLYFKHRARLRFMRTHHPLGLPTAWAYTLAKAAQLALKGYRDEARSVLSGAANRPTPKAVVDRLSPEALDMVNRGGVARSRGGGTMGGLLQKHEDTFVEAVRKYGFVATCRTRLRDIILLAQRLYYVRIWGMDIHPVTLISRKAILDKTYPAGIHINEGTAVSFDAVILSHDHIAGKHTDTHIGKFCQVGARSMVMPGVRVGDHSVIAAGAIVTKDVPPQSIVAGNPARIIRSGIMTTKWGKITDKGHAPASGTDNAPRQA